MQNTSSWQTSLRNLITHPKELLALLELDATFLPVAEQVARHFPLRVTQSFVSRMKKSDINDPLLKQVLPLQAELLPVSGYENDPLQENNHNPLPGLLHKYPGRVLVTFTGACPIHCRFCFRKNFPYQDNNPGKAGLEKILDYIENDNTIHEVILSGGDPLMATDVALAQFTEALAAIAHVKRLRIHSRIPIVLPNRIDNHFLAWATSLKQNLVIVVHCNHPQEINEEVITALKKLRALNIILLNQAVLLKGINDNVATLVSLQETLFAAGVLPYYLHVLDKVQGTAHFDLPLSQAKQLHAELAACLSGYLVPRLVCEIPGKSSKTLVYP